MEHETHIFGFTPLVAEEAIKLDNASKREMLAEELLSEGRERFLYRSSLDPYYILIMDTKQAIKGLERAILGQFDSLVDANQLDLAVQILNKHKRQI